MKQTFIIAIALLSLACQPKEPSKPKLDNGYEYQFHRDETGNIAGVEQVVTIDFEIIDEFNNSLSDSRTANIRPTVQIPPSMNATLKRNPLLSLIRVMSIGDSASVYVPVDSLSSPPQEFLQSTMVEYRVVCLNIENQDVYMDRIGSEQAKIKEDSYNEAKQAFDAYIAGEYDDKVIEKNGEVKIALLNDTQGVKADYNEAVFVHYYGFLKDGSSFDNSYKVGKPYSFRLGRGGVIQGWDVAMDEIPEGGTAIIEVPFPMAYGDEGREGVIPPQSDLYFWVKMDFIEKMKKADQ